MKDFIERTLVLLKPDAVQRGLIGEIIARFEDAGFKIVAMKMIKATKELAGKHYDESLAQRRGERVRQYNIDFISSGPVVAMVIEGVNAVENVRKFCGTTEPKSSPPGTIRGDYAHVSYGYCDNEKMVVKNVIHASEDLNFARKEIALWFKPSEIINYTVVHEIHTR